ncbi:hypothetical protein PF005_g22867 [Phytophthora fragariae]|uniref:Uncharacterized protein n=1 Tax=Phytophthora fragariae TaxID=53985 RepID=A0A6A3WA52_9STRA|nr:hypothetical protein PF003_g12164 [Phytophthora fragariae]KAE8948346.1 hypothetical protein PF009_g2075 [Phytophthora fragariae]KAE9115511.1 hypothetical protein PF007_g10001 [Phytophthora fragariae]KAE9142552.1 hypothetical protein PF006_g12341 [Phytophthora fragariae]KAE9181490.1 hypothetical protein PF005_g22867 [Phytophthora fragariae]
MASAGDSTGKSPCSSDSEDFTGAVTRRRTRGARRRQRREENDTNSAIPDENGLGESAPNDESSEGDLGEGSANDESSEEYQYEGESDSDSFSDEVAAPGLSGAGDEGGEDATPLQQDQGMAGDGMIEHPWYALDSRCAYHIPENWNLQAIPVRNR